MSERNAVVEGSPADPKTANAVVKPRREMYAEQTRAALVEAATYFFLTKGYHATSIRDIIDVAHVSKGAFYHHFSDKQALFREILMDACEAGAHSARTAIAQAQATTGKNPVLAGAEHALSALIENEPYRQLRAESIVALGLEVRREVDQSYTLPVIRESLQSVGSVSQMSAGEFDALALMLSSLLESAANEISTSPNPAEAYQTFRGPLIRIVESIAAALSGSNPAPSSSG